MKVFKTLAVLGIVVSMSMVGWGQTCGNNQACDLNLAVYENHSSSVVTVSIELTDGCPDAESYVEIYGKTTPPLGPVLDKGTIPDMKSRSFTFDVPSHGIIMFNCRGKGPGNGSTGNCSWRVVSASSKPRVVDSNSDAAHSHRLCLAGSRSVSFSKEQDNFSHGGLYESQAQ